MGFTGLEQLEKDFSYGIANKITKGINEAMKRTSQEIVMDCKAHCRVDTGAMKESFNSDMLPDVINVGDDNLLFTISCGSRYDYKAHGKTPRNYVLLWEYGFESSNYGKSNMKMTKREKTENYRKSDADKPHKIDDYIMVINGDFMFTNAVIRGQRKLIKYLSEVVRTATRIG